MVKNSRKKNGDDSSSESSEEASGPRTIELKTFYWSYEESQDHKLKIHIGGKTHKGETVQLIVDDFQPYVYVELPKRNLGWNKNRCRLLFEYFQKVLKEDPPVSWEMLAKYRLRNKLPLKCVRMRFNTHSGAQKLANKCRYKGGLNIDGLGFFKPDTLKVHEGNIDPLIKLTAVKSLKLAGWMRVTETIQPGEENLDLGDRKFSTADIDMHVKCVDIEPFTPKELRIVRPKYLSFDIECTSKNHNSRLPDPENPHNRIFSIANTIGHFGDPKRRHQLFTLGNPKDIPDVEIIRCVDEKQLLLKWKASVEEHMEDCIVGYNTMKFDWHYMIKRAQDLGIYDKFARISRLIGQKAVLRETSWMSAAYGEQKFSYLDPVGISNVDVLLEVERGHKLSSYSLKNVAEHFLKENKDDVTPRQLFMTHDLTFRLGPLLEDLPKGKLPKEKRIELKKIVQAELQLRRCHGEILAWRKRMMACKTGHDFRETLRDGLTITGKYNVQDTVLPVQLCEKLNLWMTMEEMSNCTHVPMSYLHTRGQTVKVMAQMYRETIFNNIIIPFRPKTDAPKEKFEGAIVVDAVPGDHWNVACKDFESLYPSMMIAFNICYTTIIADDDPIPDEQCNVLEFSSHLGCEHDPRHRKKKAADILCKNYRYRFRKVVIHPDGTREHEGLMPKLVRNLLVSRKIVKKEMAPFVAKLKMVEGKAESQDIEFYKKMAWEIVEKGSLGVKELEILRVNIGVLDARQLALKVCANSVRPDTPIPCRVAGVFNYLSIDDLAKPGTWVLDSDGNEVAEPIDDLLVWSDVGFTEVKYVFRHPLKEGRGEGEKLKRVYTHQGIVDVTEDHSLLTPEGEEVTTKQLKKGDLLMHVPVPIPKDSPEKPLYTTLSNEVLKGHNLETPEERKAFAHGMFFAEGTCGKYQKGNQVKHSWVIYNQDRELLERTRDYLNDSAPEGVEFYVSEYYESARCYHLLARGVFAIKNLTAEYRPTFYDGRCRKKIPEYVMNAPYLVRLAFFIGYYSGDGARHLKAGVRVSNRGIGGSAQLCYLLKSLGYKTSVNCDDKEVFRIQASEKLRSAKPHAVKRIEDETLECEPKRVTSTPEIRNGQSLKLENSRVEYNGVSIICSRIPKKEYLDWFDEIEDKNQGLGNLVEYQGGKKTRHAVFECCTCGNRVTLGYNRENLKKPRAGELCECEVKYYPRIFFESAKEDTKRYVYDIETKSHHFAAGLGDLIVHNSAYGVLGAQNGFAPLVEGASSVTAMGRRMITEAVRYIKEKYPGDPNDNDRGKAELVYGDTDSAMVKYKDLNTEESFEMGDRVCSETSHHLKCWTMGIADETTVKEPESKIRYLLNKYPRNKLEGLSDADKILIHTYDANPINLQFENLYQRYFFLTMKRYVGHAVNRKGVVICKVKKGVVLSRRDNSGVLRNTYRDAVDGVLEVHSPQQIMWKLYDNIHKLFTRQIPDADLIIFMGVKSIQGYAKKKEVKKKDGSTDVAFLDINKEIITDVAGPLDPRLVYPNIPQVLLALKMLRRGDEVPPNTRLEFLYLKKEGWVHQGEKAEDYTFYRENKSDLSLAPDYLHYLEKQLSKPITELLTVYAPPEKVLYEKIEDAFARCVEGLEEILKHKVKSLKNYERNVDPEFSSAYDSKVRVGYGAGKGVCKDCFSSFPQACKSHRRSESKRLKDKKCSDPPRKYVYKKAVTAQIQFILDSALRKKLNPSAKREIDEKKYPELVAVCRRWKSRLVLEKVYSQFADGARGPKLKKRTAKRPTQTGEKLRVMVANENVKVMLTKKVGTYERGTMVTLRGITELEEGKKKEYFYDIELPNGKLVPKVERRMLATWYLKDGTIMKDILLARGSYAVLVDHLKSVFCPLLFAKEEIKIFEVSEMQAEDDD